MALGTGLAIIGAWFFFVNRDARVKKAVLPWYIGFAAVLFVLFVWSQTDSLEVLLILVPGVAIISFLNTWWIEFCGNCGATLYNDLWFTPLRFCKKCGAPLDSGPNDTRAKP